LRYSERHITQFDYFIILPPTIVGGYFFDFEEIFYRLKKALLIAEKRFR